MTEILIVDAEQTSRIGQKLLLHHVMFPFRSPEQDEFVQIEIIEERHVVELWSQKEHYDISGKRYYYWGYRAKGENGEFYQNHWEIFPGDSTQPGWIWNKEMNAEKGETLKNVLNWFNWFDVTVGISSEIDFKPLFVDKYADIIAYCETHKSLFYKADEIGCFGCYMDRTSKERDPERFDREQKEKLAEQEKNRKWKGWK